jgi:hypothetical protein
MTYWLIQCGSQRPEACSTLMKKGIHFQYDLKATYPHPYQFLLLIKRKLDMKIRTWYRQNSILGSSRVITAMMNLQIVERGNRLQL